MSAPASRYSRCTSATTSGMVRFISSGDWPGLRPRSWSIVPMAPSSTSTRSYMACRKDFFVRKTSCSQSPATDSWYLTLLFFHTEIGRQRPSQIEMSLQGLDRFAVEQELHLLDLGEINRYGVHDRIDRRHFGTAPPR